MKKNTPFLCWLQLLFMLILPTFIVAQNDLSSGLLLEDEAYDVLPLIEKKDGSKYLIPFKKNLKMYCPTPGDQGPLGACVAWATGSYALTISKAIQYNITEKEKIDSLQLSASYIFNHIIKNGDCSKGAFLTDGLSFLQKYGTPPATLFNNSLFDCTARPESKAIQAALKNRIANFHPIFKSTAKDSIKIEETKLWIAREKPVIIGLNLTENFKDITDDQEKWLPNLQNRTNSYHAMVVVGYRDSRGEGGEFELINSHGPYWGNKGFIKLNYKDYAQLVKYAFVIDSIGVATSFSPKTPNLPLLLGTPNSSTTLEINRIQYKEDDSPMFVPAPFKYNPEKRCYQAQDTWERYNQYQLIAKNLFTGRRLYAFSFDARQRVIPIWPSDYPKEKQYTEITIPSERSALALSYVGKNYLVLLYSMGELKDFDDRLQTFKSLTGNFEERLKTAFGEVLIDEKLVDYATDQLQFNCTSPKATQSVIPLIITFDVQAE